MPSSKEELTKVLVELPNHWATPGESMSARPLGNDLYEPENCPFHAYDLNYRDGVYAIADDPWHKPIVRRVERRSGRRTLRVVFLKHVSVDLNRSRWLCGVWRGDFPMRQIDRVPLGGQAE